MSLRLFSLLALGILVVFFGGFYLGSLLNFPSPDFNPTQESTRINPFGIRNDTSPEEGKCRVYSIGFRKQHAQWGSFGDSLREGTDEDPFKTD